MKSSLCCGIEVRYLKNVKLLCLKNESRKCELVELELVRKE